MRAKVDLETVGKWNLVYDLPLSYSGALCELIQFTSIPVWLVNCVRYCSIWISDVNNIVFNSVTYGEVCNYSYLYNRCNYVFLRTCRFLFFCCRLKSCDSPVLVAQLFFAHEFMGLHFFTLLCLKFDFLCAFSWGEMVNHWVLCHSTWSFTSCSSFVRQRTSFRCHGQADVVSMGWCTALFYLGNSISLLFVRNLCILIG